MPSIEKDIADLIYFLYCGLNNKTPDKKRIDNVNLKQLFMNSKKQNVSNIVYYALKKSDGFKNQYWETDFVKSIKREMMFEAERKKIYEFLNDNKIWYCPLKGLVIKELYPEYGLREMGDNDILFDTNYENLLNKYMDNNGYDVETGELHNMYTKKPVFNFEFHKRLFNKNPYLEFFNYFSDLDNRLVKNNNSYCRKFNDEDFYLSVVCHRYKHTEVTGSGFKFLIDIYIYLKHKPNLDINYVSKVADKLNIADFELRGRELSYKLFDSEMLELGDLDIEEIRNMVGAGVYGTTENYVQNKFKKYGKSPRLFFSYFFPSKTSLKDRGQKYPKYSIFLPIYWVLLYKKFFKSRDIKTFIKALKK
ncbi:MAG: nucleotidyltransferase family protein [Coriobacteriia bacterium]|nr:nucleotidyltransferase family protein [Coriobacteriia bacterium]